MTFHALIVKGITAYSEMVDGKGIQQVKVEKCLFIMQENWWKQLILLQ